MKVVFLYFHKQFIVALQTGCGSVSTLVVKLVFRNSAWAVYNPPVRRGGITAQSPDCCVIKSWKT